MKSSHNYVILLFVLFSYNLLAQRYALIQIEFGIGVMSTLKTDLAAVVPFSIELKTQRGLFDFSLKYQKGVKGLGVDHPQSRLFTEKKNLFTTLSTTEADYLNRLENWEAYQVWGDVHTKIGYFNPIIGLGVSINRIKGFIKKDNIYTVGGNIDSYIIAPSYYPTLNLRLGHKVGNLRFYIESQILKNKNIPAATYFGTAVNFALTPRRKKEVDLYKKYKEEKRFAGLVFRAEFVGGYLFLVNKRRDASSFFAGVDMQFRIMTEHFLGMSATITSRNNGYDSDTQEIKPDYIVTNASQQLRFYTLYYRYNRQYRLAKAFFFGGGIGRYKLATNLKTIPLNSILYKHRLRFNTALFTGLNVHVGVRSSLISHTLTVHFPFTSSSSFVEYKMGIGLSFHK